MKMQKVYQCELSELFPDADDKKPLPDGMDFVIRDLLYCLGVTEKHVGFPHTLYAVRLSIQQPERLMLVTKWLYPDVAKQYHTSWQNVEKNIRTTVTIAWHFRPDILSFLANRTLGHKPSNTEFISILVHYLKGPVSKTAIQPFAQIS